MSEWARQICAGELLDADIVCFPPTGGGVTSFVGLRRAFAGVANVWAIEAPGRGSRLSTPPVLDFYEYVEAAARGIRPETGGKVILVGVSFGAVLALEAARRLHDTGSAVERLVTVCGRSPASYDVDAEEPPTMLSARRFVESAGLTPPEMLEIEEADDLFVRPVLDDLMVARTYRGASTQPVTFPITTASAVDDPLVEGEEAQLWRAQTTSDWQILKLAGGHYAHTAFTREQWLSLVTPDGTRP